MYKAILKSIKDIFSKDVLLFILKISIFTILFWALIFWLFWDFIQSFLSYLLSYIPYIGNISFMQKAGGVILAILLFYILIIITLSFLTSIFSEKLIIKLAFKNYNLKPKYRVSLSSSILASLKGVIKFIIGFVFLFWAIFIPIIGAIVMLFLWALLLSDSLIIDVGALFFSKEELKYVKKESKIASLIASILNYIPILNIFSPIFAQILFLHLSYSKLTTLKRLQKI